MAIRRYQYVQALFTEESKGLTASSYGGLLKVQPLGQDAVTIFRNYVFHQLPTYLLSIDDRGEGSLHFRLIKCDGLKAEDYIREEVIASRLDKSPKVSRDKVIRDLVEQELRYAVFSHRWLKEEEEAKFEDVQKADLTGSGTHALPGFKKLVNFCTMAVENGCSLAWADTACIDRKSSAELEQAIRSMFNWYRSSHVCIVHLAESSEIAEIEKDPWFTRGWTLQELLAPARIKFYNKDWKPLGDSPNDKNDDYIMGVVSRTTEIGLDSLRRFSPGLLNVREKMVWASKRETKFDEDVAYSLLGIFDISMPITYGEGKRAFRRLMEVIVQDCREWQIFAWAGPHSPYTMAFPESPRGFGREYLGEVNASVLNPQRPIHRPWDLGYPFYSMKKAGLEIKVLFVKMILQIDRRAEPKAGPHCKRLTFHPAEYQGYLKNTEAVCDSRFLFYSEWAVGVINYQTDGKGKLDEKGELEANKTYVCFLFGRGFYTPSTKWEKVGTMKVLTIRTKEVVRKELETVWL